MCAGPQLKIKFVWHIKGNIRRVKSRFIGKIVFFFLLIIIDDSYDACVCVVHILRIVYTVYSFNIVLLAERTVRWLKL